MSRKPYKKIKKKSSRKIKKIKSILDRTKNWLKLHKKILLRIFIATVIGLLTLILIIDTITIFDLKNERSKETNNTEITSNETDNKPKDDLDKNIDENNVEQDKEETDSKTQTNEVVREIVIREVPQETEGTEETEIVEEKSSSPSYTLWNDTNYTASEKDISEGASICARDDTTGRPKDKMTVDNIWIVRLSELDGVYFYDFNFIGVYGHCIYDFNTKRAGFVGFNPSDESINNLLKELR